MGSHGYGLFKRALLGRVSDYCVRNASCPVLIVNNLYIERGGDADGREDDELDDGEGKQQKTAAHSAAVPPATSPHRGCCSRTRRRSRSLLTPQPPR
ncbi:Os11g0621825 [Oryza sativa Japonica Group]|uniref:Os11g0621825 protein n=1 Tax=Oryza sativa subsp. japonica TaxID=39947 RepID=A0A0P0Y4W2_ORYSJ|nr:hypothetical protein EE612_056704 [Oryza sativa]BAT14911.1 Os11g0621825 [Oryza sativa Japonica Group]